MNLVSKKSARISRNTSPAILKHEDEYIALYRLSATIRSADRSEETTTHASHINVDKAEDLQSKYIPDERTIVDYGKKHR